uniref:Uncharacterized protein n=1 Tax=Arundo donax TaxID=35708 RepID=A0A0A9FFC9_ARUDO
MAFPDLQKNK